MGYIQRDFFGDDGKQNIEFIKNICLILPVQLIYTIIYSVLLHRNVEFRKSKIYKLVNFILTIEVMVICLGSWFFPTIILLPIIICEYALLVIITLLILIAWSAIKINAQKSRAKLPVDIIFHSLYIILMVILFLQVYNGTKEYLIAITFLTQYIPINIKINKKYAK